VAVSLTGSDALIHGLARLEFANECLADAAKSLDAAADHGLFTDNLFYHQSQSAIRLRKVQKNDRAGLPPELPADPKEQVTVFQQVNDGIPDKYRSHPTDNMRERNAKRIYVRSVIDERSPWILFGNSRGLKTVVTSQFYFNSLNRHERYDPRSAATVQEFIDAEHAETTYDPKYQSWYDDRFINAGELQLLPPRPWLQEQLTTWFADWPPRDLEERVKKYRERQGEYGLLQGLESGELQLTGNTFTFRGDEYSKRDVKRLLDDVDRELESEIESFRKLDREAFLAHWSLTRVMHTGDGANKVESELLERYRFHEALQGLLRGMLGEQGRLRAICGFLTNNRQLNEADFGAIRDGLQEVHKSLRNNLKDASEWRTPALINVPAGSSLYDLILDRGDRSMERLEGDSISGEWIGKLATRLEGVLGRLKRLHFKSLGSLLVLQEKLASQFAAAQVAKQEPAPVASNTN
jgi:hypothetical protein